MTMREARDEWESQRKAVKTAEKKKEEDKRRMGEALMSAAMARKSSSSSDDDQDDSGGSLPDNGEVAARDEVEIVEVEQQGSAKKKRKHRQNVAAIGISEIDPFGVPLKEADLARIDLERERLAFEQELAVADRFEREKERKGKREKRIGKSADRNVSNTAGLSWRNTRR